MNPVSLFPHLIYPIPFGTHLPHTCILYRLEATCPTYVIALDSAILFVFGKKYKCGIFSLCSLTCLPLRTSVLYLTYSLPLSRKYHP